MITTSGGVGDVSWVVVGIGLGEGGGLTGVLRGP